MMTRQLHAALRYLGSTLLLGLAWAALAWMTATTFGFVAGLAWGALTSSARLGYWLGLWW